MHEEYERISIKVRISEKANKERTRRKKNKSNSTQKKLKKIIEMQKMILKKYRVNYQRKMELLSDEEELINRFIK